MVQNKNWTTGSNENLDFKEIINIINARYEYTEAIDTLLYQSSDSYSSSRLTYYQKSKSRGQKQEELAFELFDPSEEF